MKRSFCRILIMIPLLAAAVSDRGRESCMTMRSSSTRHVHVIDRQLYHGGDIGERVSDGQFDLPRAKEGGVDAMFFSVFVTEDYYPQRLETKQTLRLIDLALHAARTKSRQDRAGAECR